MRRHSGIQIIFLCFIIIFTSSRTVRASESRIKYYAEYKAVEISGQTGPEYYGYSVTVMLKSGNRILNIGETQIDLYGNYRYVFEVTDLPKEAELFVKCADKDITSTVYETLLKSYAPVNVFYQIKEGDAAYRITANMSPILKLSKKYVVIAAQYDGAGALVHSDVFYSDKAENKEYFDKTVDKKGVLKVFVWQETDKMVPSACLKEGGGELVLKFGQLADKQTQEGYSPLMGENNYQVFTQAKEEIEDEFQLQQPVTPECSREFYVSADGNDNALGDFERPFATIARAVEEYMQLSEAEKNDWTAIYIRGGNYNVSESIDLSDAKKLYISAYQDETVSLNNKLVCKGYNLHEVTQSNTERSIINRINPEVNRLYYCNYSDLGIESLDGFAYGNTGKKPKLLYNGIVQTLARYPNGGDTYIDTVIDAGYDDDGNYTENVEFIPTDKQPFSWSSNNKIGISGQLCVTWYYNHMEASFDFEKGTVKTPSRQTVSQGNKCAVRLVNHPEDRAHFYYYNVFEEIDMPGEWCAQDAEGRIYFYPGTEKVSSGDEIAIMNPIDGSIFRINSCENIVLNNIKFDMVKDAVKIENCEKVMLQNCDFSNISGRCVNILSSEYCGVINSSFENCDGGVNIGGSAQALRDLKAERNFVQNCHFNALAQTCVIIGESCGNIISHNLGENYQASFASVFGGCENIIEYNESASGGFNGNEAYIIYIDGQYNARNNHVRYNYIHDNSPDPNSILLGQGIALDDVGESNFVYGNIIKNLGGTIGINGGDNNIIDGNIIINSTEPIKCSDGMYSPEEAQGNAILDDLRKGRLTYRYYNYGLGDGTNWSMRYPKAVDRMKYLEEVSRRWNTGDHTSEEMMFMRAATGNYIVNNIMVNSPDIITGPSITDFYYSGNPENGVPDLNGNDYSVVWNNKSVEKFDIESLDYFEKIGMTYKPTYKEEEISVIYPSAEEPYLSSNEVNIVWTAAERANAYRVIVSEDADFSTVYQSRWAIDNRIILSLQNYSYGEKKYYYKIEAYNSGDGGEPFFTTSAKSVVLAPYIQTEDKTVISNKTSQFASAWNGVVGNQYIRYSDSGISGEDMSESGNSFIRVTTDDSGKSYRFVWGSGPYATAEKYNSVYDKNTTMSANILVRFPNKEKFASSVCVPFMHFSPSALAEDVSYGGNGKAVYFKIEKSADKYILFKGITGQGIPETQIGEYSGAELFARWIPVNIEVNMATGQSKCSFDNIDAAIDMNYTDWNNDGYRWNTENYLRFFDFIINGSGENQTIVDIRDVSVVRKVNH